MITRGNRIHEFTEGIVFICMILVIVFDRIDMCYCNLFTIQYSIVMLQIHKWTLAVLVTVISIFIEFFQWSDRMIMFVYRSRCNIKHLIMTCSEYVEIPCRSTCSTVRDMIWRGSMLNDCYECQGCGPSSGSPLNLILDNFHLHYCSLVRCWEFRSYYSCWLSYYYRGLKCHGKKCRNLVDEYSKCRGNGKINVKISVT